MITVASSDHIRRLATTVIMAGLESEDHRGRGRRMRRPGSTVIFAAERPGTRTGVGP